MNEYPWYERYLTENVFRVLLFLATLIARLTGCSGALWVWLLRNIQDCPKTRYRWFRPWTFPGPDAVLVLLDNSCIEWYPIIGVHDELVDPATEGYLLTEFWHLWLLPRGFRLVLIVDPAHKSQWGFVGSRLNSFLGIDHTFWARRRLKLLERCREKKAVLLNI